MNDLYFIACGSGLRDGFNPCIFMACAVSIAYFQWLRSPLVWFRVIFGLVYMSGVLAFNFWPPQIFVLQKGFIFTGKILYLILGAWAFGLGVLFLKDWLSLSSGLPVEDKVDKEIKIFPLVGLTVYLTAIFAAVILSALATLWPVDRYIIILGNAAISKGQWQMVTPLLASYVLISMWPLWLVWSLLSVKNLRPSLLKILCASIFFTASSCIVLIFK